jgi:hypothetical protein
MGRVCAVLLTSWLAIGSLLGAQEEAPPALEFSFSNPGARSMGFGGAFVALADDATAAFANPAGLVQLSRPEISLEGRYWSYSTPFVSGGRIFGPATGNGLDTSPGLRIGESSIDVTGLSFLSYTYPRDRWSIALYRHVVADYEFFGEMDSLFAGPWPGFPDSRERSWELRKAIDLELVAHGVAVALQATERLSLGVGASQFRGSMWTLSETFGFDDPADPQDFWSFRTDFAPEFLVEASTVYGDDHAFGFLAGLLWQPTDRWRVGAVFRQGPDLEGTSEVAAGPMNRLSVPAGTVLSSSSGRIAFPDVLGIGAAYRSRHQRLTIAFEWDRVGYSSILESSPEFFIEDAHEIHFGAEYVFLDSSPVVAARLGAWLDPDHRIRYAGSNYIAQAVLQPGSDELHVSLGLGLAYERFQLDLGIDLADVVDTLSLSTIFTF